MVISLLIAALSVEANADKFSSNVGNDRAMIDKSSDGDLSFSKNSVKFIDGHERDSIVRRRATDGSRKNVQERGSKFGRSSRTSPMEYRFPRSDARGLAKKLANEALKSPKMQETMRKLTRITTPGSGPYEVARIPVFGSRHSAAKPKIARKAHEKPSHRKGRRKKKRKRHSWHLATLTGWHHRRFQNHHNQWPKRGASKKIFDTRRDTGISTPAGDGKQNSILKRNRTPVDEKTHNKSSNTKSSDKVHIMKLEEHDYVDFSTTLDTEFPVTAAATRDHERSTYRNENESMIDSIMKTTTKDPVKKHPVDQGMEYSDYYSYDEVLDDIAANKIQMKIDEPRSPNDRFVRQTVNTSSFYNDDGNAGNVQPYYQDFHKYGTDSGNEDGSVNYLDNFPNYPTINQSPGLSQNSPLSGTDQDPSFDYQLNYSPVFGDENEDLNLAYSNTEEMPVAVQPETFDEVTVSNFENNNENRQPVIDLPRYPEGLNDLNTYESPDAKEAENTHYGENVVEPLMENKYSDLYKQSGVQLNSIPDVSGLYNNFDIPPLHDPYSNPEVRNFELSQMQLPHFHYDENQPDVEGARLTDVRKETSGDQWDHVVENPQSSNNIDAPQLSDGISTLDNSKTIQSQTGNGRLTGLRIEGDETQPSFQRPVYSGKQDFSQYYNNQYGKRGEQILKSFSLQPNGVRNSENKNYDRPHDFPSINLPNPMKQPFGKVLESLGINVNGNSSGPSRELKSDLNEKTDPVPVENNPIRKVSGPSLPSTGTSLERPVEYILSPNHGWKKSRQESGRNHEGSPGDEEGNKPKKLNNDTRANEKHPRSQLTLSRDKPGNDNLVRLLEEEQEQNKNAPTTANETKEVANQILGTIIDELEDLKLSHAKTNNKREGLPCRLTGSWTTAQAGIMLDMKIVNRTIVVTLSRLPAPRFHESFLNGTWNMTGHIPFHRGGPFTLTAVDNQTNSIAVFVGACRVCQGVDTIAGVWSIARLPRDCRDFQIATSVYNDVFHKTTLSSLKEKHQVIDSSSRNTTNSFTTTAKNGKSNG